MKASKYDYLANEYRRVRRNVDFCRWSAKFGLWCFIPGFIAFFCVGTTLLFHDPESIISLFLFCGSFAFLCIILLNIDGRIFLEKIKRRDFEAVTKIYFPTIFKETVLVAAEYEDPEIFDNVAGKIDRKEIEYLMCYAKATGNNGLFTKMVEARSKAKPEWVKRSIDESLTRKSRDKSLIWILCVMGLFLAVIFFMAVLANH